jgi:hypothetical protein
VLIPPIQISPKSLVAISAFQIMPEIHEATNPAPAFLPVCQPATLAGNEKGGDNIAAVSLSHFLGQPVAEL